MSESRSPTDGVAGFYDDFVDYELSYLSHPNRRHRRVREHPEPLLARRPGSALDVGCGIGLLTRWLGQRVPRVVGVDVSPRSIEICRELHPEAEFSICVLPDESLPGGPFDLVTFIDVLEHVPRAQLRLVFERVAEVVSEEAVIAINLPSRLFAQTQEIQRQVIDEAVPVGEVVAAAGAIGMEPLTISRYGVAYANQYVFCAFSRSYDVATPVRNGVGDRFRDRVWYAQRRFATGKSTARRFARSER
jgi:trans-aconitate methyltransferase